MRRQRFTGNRDLYATACVLNRFHACTDSTDFIEATEFSNAFDRAMIRADRAAFWESTCAA